MVDAAVPDPARAARSTAQGRVKLVCFRLHGQEYGASIGDIKETMAVRPITRVFLTPPWLAGIINLRGDIVAVIDLGQILGLPPASMTASSRIVICRSRDGQPATGIASQGSGQGSVKIAGVVVDELTELRTLDLTELQPPPPTLARTGDGEGAALLRCVLTLESGAPLGVLDLGNLFECNELRALRREGT